MKINLPSLCLLLALFFTGAARAGSVTVSVAQTGSREKNKTDKFTTTEEKKLTITLQNVSHAALENLNVKYYFFGRSADTKSIAIVSQGAKTVSVPAVSSVTVESDPGKASFTEKHQVKKAMVPASGSKFLGYGAQVFSGGTLLGEYFSPPEMKQNLGGQ